MVSGPPAGDGDVGRVGVDHIGEAVGAGGLLSAIVTRGGDTLEGVHAAGDVTSLHSHQVSAAVHEGAQAASAADYFLYPPELKAS